MDNQTTDFISSLQESQQAYRKSAVYETLLALDLPKVFTKPKTVEVAADLLKLNVEAFSRFLHAAVNLDLLEKVNNRFIARKNTPVYSKDSSLILFWLFNSKIADFLQNSSRSLDEIIDHIDDANQKILDSAVKYNLLIKDKNNFYSVPSDTRKYFLSNSNDYIGPRIRHFEQVMFPMFSVRGLIGALKTGKSQWDTFANEGVTHPFNSYKTRSELLEFFTNGMHLLNIEDDRILAENLNLKDIKSVLDVGGGSGSFALQLLNQSNFINYIDIYELPDAIPLMKKIFFKYAANETRVNFIPGSFMEATKEGNLSGLETTSKYDLIVLGWILHDWTDKTNKEILSRVIKHLNPGKQLLIIECILPENRIGNACQADLAMLLQTEGKERTLSEFQSLLVTSGFSKISILKTNTRRQAILAEIL